MLGFAALACADPGPPPDPADLVLLHGKVVTVDDELPEAQAIAVLGDTIQAVGGDAEIERYVGEDTEVIDLEGRLVIPGLIEGHGHLMGLGSSLMNLDLMDSTSYEDIVVRVEQSVADLEPGAWLLGRGWHQSKWDRVPEPVVRGFQTHDWLSEVTPNNPVYLTHASGHAGFANAKAMELAGVTPDIESPPGGEIIKDEDGNPTGIFVETAQRLIRSARAEADAELNEEQRYERSRHELRLAIGETIRNGITTFHDAGAGANTIDLYKDALADGELDIRLYVMLRAGVDEMPDLLPRLRAIGLGDDHLTVRAIKLGIDGALGPRGAWLLEPYEDDVGTSGFNTTPIERIERVAALALEHGYQLCVHAIGDRANRTVLDIYEAAFEADPEAARDARFRIEHSQLLAPSDVPRFDEMNVIASMEGVHATSDGPWTPDRLGHERTQERAYQFRALTDSGAIIMNGTDVPVERIDPMASFAATFSLVMNNGEVLNESQRLTRQETLRSYTLNAAYGAFEEDIKGSITVGKLADLTVLSADILTVPTEEVLSARALYTIVGGKVVYRAQ